MSRPTNSRVQAAVVATPQNMRHLAMMPISLGILWSFWGHIGPLDIAAIWSDMGDFHVASWLMAALFTAVSFTAISRYDVLATGYLGQPIPARTAMAVGWRATALSQVTGFGLVTGSLSRWRMVSRNGTIPLTECAKMTALICTLFLAGWAVVTCVIVLAAPTLVPGAKTLALAGCLISLGLLFVLVMPPSFLTKRLPSCRFAIDTVLLSFIDTAAAALVIYVFLPDGYVPFLTLYAAFLMAFAAGMFSNLPGGVGAFELCLVALLSPADPAPLICAMMSYRLVYYAIPAALALPALAKPLRWDATPLEIAQDDVPPQQLTKVAPPELTLIAHGQLSLISDRARSMGVLTAETGNCRLILGDSFGADYGLPLVSSLQRGAAQKQQATCLYKCSARLAAAVRRDGYRVLRIGQEAAVDPQEFSLESRAFRQLRRKLRGVEKAGIEIAPNRFGWDMLARIDQSWQAKNGRAKGFSMGVFDPAMLRRQLVLTASRDGVPIAYVSFHIGETRWALDLIRSGEDCPDGTIHALIHEAIKLAKAENITRLSLAAAPFSGLEHGTGLAARLMAKFYGGSARLKGLYQFKQSFAPAWTPCYIAANSWPGLVHSALELRQLIHADHTARDETGSDVHNDYVDYEIASSS